MRREQDAREQDDFKVEMEKCDNSLFLSLLEINFEKFLEKFTFEK